MTIVEVFADIVCPFTHVGLRRFVDHRERVGRHDVRLHVRSWPLELVNGVPMDVGAVAMKVGVLRDQVAPDLFTGFDADTFPQTSLPALALTASAYDRGIAEGEAVALEFRDLLWEQGVDIADPAVLDDVAARHGLQVPTSFDRVDADLAAGRTRGVVGSPHFHFGDLDAFCPSLQIEKVDGVLHVAFDTERFDALMGDVLGR